MLRTLNRLSLYSAILFAFAVVIVLGLAVGYVLGNDETTPSGLVYVPITVLTAFAIVVIWRARLRERARLRRLIDEVSAKAEQATQGEAFSDTMQAAARTSGRYMSSKSGRYVASETTRKLSGKRRSKRSSGPGT